MRTNLKATRVLMIDASLIVLIAIVLVVSNLYLLDRVNRELTGIDAVRLKKLDLIEQMKHVVRERSIVMLDMSVEKDLWEIEAKSRTFHSLAADFIRARDELRGMSLQESEQKVLQKSLSIIKTTEQLQADIVDRIRDGHMQGVERDIVQKDFPLEFRLLGTMETLSEVVVDSTNKQRMQAKSDYQRITILMSLVSFVLVLIIILLIWRSLTKIRRIETGLIKKTDNLGWDATHDPLTNIYNRRWLKHKVEIQLNMTGTDSAEHALLYMDLDGFKQINDSFGHVAGDRYLVGLCREIEHGIRQTDTFCRMGGDEFAILLENCGRNAPTEIAEQLIDRIRRFTLRSDGQELRTSASIGVCLFGDEDVGFDDLVRRADELCYEAKWQGRNRIVIGTLRGASIPRGLLEPPAAPASPALGESE